MSADLKFGNVIHGSAQRDAVHVAVAPVEAAEELQPGEHIGFVNREANTVGKSTVNPKFGIVDPFLKTTVKVGQIIWAFVYPGTIRSLRHEWTHCEFAATPDKRSELWIRNWAEAHGLDYDDVMSHAQEYVKCGDYWCEGGRFEGQYVPDEFWSHYEMVTGETVEEKDRGSFFTCSC